MRTRILLLFAILVAFALPAHASTRYIAATAGTYTGGSACNGQTAITPTTWNSTAETAGDISYVCGLITGTAGQTLLTFGWSGSSGSPLQLIFDTGADLQAPYWGSSNDGAIDTAGQNWIVINGGTNGIIENMANGTNLTYQQSSHGIWLSGSSNVTVENLTVANMCQHTAVTDLTGCIANGNGDSGIQVNSSGSMSNVTVTKNAVHDSQGCIFYSAGNGDSGVTISDNTLSRCNWEVGADQSGTSSGFTITGNDITCVAGSATCNWDTYAQGVVSVTNGSPTVNWVSGTQFNYSFVGSTLLGGGSPPYNVSSVNSATQITLTTNWTGSTGNQSFNLTDQAFHHNGIMIFPQDTDTMNSVVIANNYIHDINGLQGGTNEETGHIFLDPSGTGDLPGVQIYNNVLITTTGDGPSNAFITIGTGVTNSEVFNNTLSGSASQGISGQLNPTFKNNIIDGVFTGIFLNSSYTTPTSNYNDIYGLTGGTQSMIAGGSSYSTVAAWTTGTALDANSVTTNPNLTAAFMLQANLTGTNLTSLSIAGLDVGAPQYFGVSYACGTGCVARPSSGNWDMGAYPYSSAGVPVAPAPTMFTLAPPTNLTAKVLF